MKSLEELSLQYDALSRQFDELERKQDDTYRRLLKAEAAAGKDSIPRTAPRNPMLSSVWHDVESGKLKVWNGTTWDTFTKD